MALTTGFKRFLGLVAVSAIVGGVGFHASKNNYYGMLDEKPKEEVVRVAPSEPYVEPAVTRPAPPVAPVQRAEVAVEQAVSAARQAAVPEPAPVEAPVAAPKANVNKLKGLDKL